MRPLIIGIAGGSGSGKTTLVERLCEQFGEDVSVLTHASYYTPRPDLTDEERDGLNLDHPASFDTDRLISDLKESGTTIILVSHNMDEAARNCDRVCAIKDGKIIKTAVLEQ